MRILVFDNNPINRAAALAQLKGHDVTVVETYDEAQKLLIPWVDREKALATLRDRFGDFDPYHSDDERKMHEYFEAEPIAFSQAVVYPNFDVVLCELLVPASQQFLDSVGRKLAGEDMPVGIFIGLLAAVRASTKYIAVFTDSDRASHPASACLEALNPDGASYPTTLKIYESIVIFSNSTNWIRQFNPSDLSEPLKYQAGPQPPDTVRAKDWVALLTYLIPRHLLP